MKIEVKQNIIAGMLERVILAMPPKGERNPIEFNLADGVMSISCNDGDLYIITETSVVTFDGTGTIFLPSFFKDIVKRSEGDTLILEVEDGKRMLISDNLGFSSNVRIQTGSPSMPPELKWDDAFVINREAFIKALDSVKLAVAAESGQPALMQAKIGGGIIVGTNSARYHEAPFPDFGDGTVQVDSTIPQQVIDAVIKVLNMSEAAEVSFVQSDYESGINVGGTRVIYNKLEYEFPEWVLKIPAAVVGNTMKFYVNKSELAKKIEKVAITIDPSSKNLNCQVKGNSLIVIAKDQFGNESKDVVTGKEDGANGRVFDVNYRYLLDSLTALKGVDITISLGNDKANKKSAVVFGDDFCKCILVQTVVG